jgi:hypothetical protein
MIAMTSKNDLEHSIGSRGIARRETLRSLALGTVAVLASGAVIEPAFAHQGANDECMQEGWRWCRKCGVMFYAVASAGKGVCPAGGAHDDSASGHYLERFGEDRSGQQGGWRWCKRCAAFFYARASIGAGGKGLCPAPGGGPHDDSASGKYAAVLGEDGRDPSGQLFQQGGWRWCRNCAVMFYARATNPTVCPRGGAHNASASGKYASVL